MRIEFTIPLIVEPKQGGRGRVASVGGKTYVQQYQPKKVRDNAAAITTLCAEHRPFAPMRGPVRLSLSFRYPWRTSEPKKRRNGSLPKDTKPDLGNLEKQIVDELERTGFFVNDSQVAEKHSQKNWTEQGSVLVVIETM